MFLQLRYEERRIAFRWYDESEWTRVRIRVEPGQVPEVHRAEHHQAGQICIASSLAQGLHSNPTWQLPLPIVAPRSELSLV